MRGSLRIRVLAMVWMAAEGPVPVSVEPATGGLAAGCFDGAGFGEFGEGGVVAAAPGMGERDDGLGGADRTDSGPAGQPETRSLTMAVSSVWLALSARAASRSARASRRISAWRTACPGGICGLTTPGQPC